MGISNQESIDNYILFIIKELDIKPSRFIKEYRKNYCNIEKTIEYFLKNYLQYTDITIKKNTINKSSNIKDLRSFLARQNAATINISSKYYPELLKQIYYPPPIIFYKGKEIKNFSKFIGIVGTRKSTAYGRDAAVYLSGQLSGAGITVVSGMATGIDFWAHTAAIKNIGGSLGVLGCGINVIYPEINRRLYSDILMNGGIVTEFFPGVPPIKSNFPARNRIISGLSMGVVVIEAPEKSGALITADFALNQNREVFVVPGSIFSNESRGSNNLIKNGAKLVNDIDDILNEIIQFLDEDKNKIILTNIKNDIKKSSEKEKNKNLNSTFFKSQDKKNKAIAGKWDLNKKNIYDFIGFKPKSIEEILIYTKLNISEVLKILAELELENMIEEKKINQYARL